MSSAVLTNGKSFRKASDGVRPKTAGDTEFYAASMKLDFEYGKFNFIHFSSLCRTSLEELKLQAKSLLWRISLFIDNYLIYKCLAN
jgi:hypothetical protein